MAKQQTLLQKLKQLQEQKKLGFLGSHIVLTSYMFASMYSHCGNERTQDEMLEEIRKKEIYAKFGVYSSSIERLAIDIFEGQEPDQKNDAMKPRNFTLYFGVKDTSIIMHPCHFHYNGSWECLEEEMKMFIIC